MFRSLSKQTYQFILWETYCNFHIKIFKLRVTQLGYSTVLYDKCIFDKAQNCLNC